MASISVKEWLSECLHYLTRDTYKKIRDTLEANGREFDFAGNVL